MFFSNFIMNVTGVDGAMHLVVAASVLRLSMYTLLASWPTTWLVLPVELLHGLTFGLAWAAGTHKAAQLAPNAGLMASMQAGILRPYHATSCAIPTFPSTDPVAVSAFAAGPLLGNVHGIWSRNGCACGWRFVQCLWRTSCVPVCCTLDCSRRAVDNSREIHRGEKGCKGRD